MEKKAKKRRRKRMSPLAKLLILALIVGSLYKWLTSDMFLIQSYEVTGNSYYSDEEILVMGKCETGSNIFFNAGLKEIKERLSKDAYMENVTVKRSLPDTITITITERVQIAAVAYGSEYVVIDQEGTVLRKTEVSPKLTVIKGLSIGKFDTGETLEVEESVLLRQTLEMLASMKEGDLYFKKIEISTLQIKAYIYDSLICQGTPDNLATAIESGKLQLVIQELFDREIERGTIKVSSDDYISFTPEID